MRAVFTRYSYSLLSLILIFIQSVLILRAEWSGDFWEHAAVVKELSVNFFHPSHPMLNLDAPHSFFSPYTLLIALFSKLSGMDAIKSLQCFAFFDLLFFMVSFRFFCKQFFTEYSDSIASLGLIFVLFFWGTSPLLWSGFYHIFVLNYILPYPSTFSICLSFIVLGFFSKHEPGFDARTFLVTVLIAVVFLTHPYTGIFLAITLVSLAATWHNNIFFEKICSLAIAGSFSFILCCFWPYYNFFTFITGDNNEFHEISKALYLRIPGSYWPVMLLIPLQFLIRRSPLKNFLNLSITLMILFYVGGYLFNKNGFGRIISGVMLFSNLYLAFAVVNLSFCAQYANYKSYSILILIVFFVSLFRNSNNLESIFNFSKKVDTSYYTKFAFLRSYVSHDDVILSDPLSNWYIPAYEGKVIASAHPLFAVPDQKERARAVEAFFSEETTELKRNLLLKKYRPKFLLLNLENNSTGINTILWMEGLGETIYCEKQIKLIKLRQNLYSLNVP